MEKMSTLPYGPHGHGRGREEGNVAMLKQKSYRPASIGAYDGPTNETPGRLSGTAQEISFLVSITMQLATLVISIIALVQGGLPNTLMLIVVLELAVQAVEICWYSVVGGLYFFGRGSVEIGYRYADWIITTPIMMTSILLFVLWDGDKQCDNVLGETSRMIALVIIIVMDVLMLFVGFVYETKDDSTPGSWRVMVTNALDMAACNMKNRGLYLGFVPFIGVFAPLFVAVGSAFTTWGLISSLLTFVAWALYGVVAILGVEGYWDAEMRNTAYNVLDIFSKNAVGIIVSSVAIGNDFNVTAVSNCTTY